MYCILWDLFCHFPHCVEMWPYEVDVHKGEGLGISRHGEGVKISESVDIFYGWLFCECLSCRHVQVSNSDAIAFYERFGFRIIDRKENYYKRIEPADAFVLQKNLKPIPETDGSTGGVESCEITMGSPTQSETVSTAEWPSRTRWLPMW